MNKKGIIKKACGKGGPFDVMKAGASGAINAYNANLANDKRLMGFNDIGSYLGAGAKGVLGGVIGAAKEAKNEIQGKKQDVLKRAVNSIPTGSPINGINNGPIKPSTSWSTNKNGRKNKISI
jgi:hypothetical protein